MCLCTTANPQEKNIDFILIQASTFMNTSQPPDEKKNTFQPPKKKNIPVKQTPYFRMSMYQDHFV